MDLLYAELTAKIVGASIEVLSKLKPGLNEKAYERALVIELNKIGCATEQQRRFDVHYDGQIIDLLIPDLIVSGVVIADTKVVEAFTSTHIAQMVGYLNITKLRLALLLNFNHATFYWRRVIL